MTDPLPPTSFDPTHDEASRQNFVGALKGYANMVLEGHLAEVYDRSLAPAFQDRHGRPPESRGDAEAVMAAHPLYHLWAQMTYHSQELLWRSVMATTQRTLGDQQRRVAALADRADKLGSMTLDPALEVPRPVSSVEIHRQPGGYTHEAYRGDISAALSYMGAIEIYRNAKAMGTGAAAGSDDIGQFLCDVIQRRFPDLAPTAILDMGCGTGEQTVAFKKRFADADVYGIDCSAPFVRFAHATAEGQDLALHVRQMDAQRTGFEDASFDLIVSIILFHETSHSQVPRILRECRRLLRPGGVMLHLDVPYQPHRLPLVKQVTNNWQVRHNGEPFWTRFAELDLKRMLIDAGFDADAAIVDYEKVGQGEYLVFGGRERTV